MTASYEYTVLTHHPASVSLVKLSHVLELPLCLRPIPKSGCRSTALFPFDSHLPSFFRYDRAHLPKVASPVIRWIMIVRKESIHELLIYAP